MIPSVKRRICVTITLMILAVMVAFNLSNNLAQDEFRIERVTLTVYRDGLVHVLQIVDVNETIPEISLPLLSASVNNTLVLDENRTVLDYEINGSNITILTLGATKVVLEYDTFSLTSMEAGVWTLSLKSPYNLMVILPQDADLIFLNKMPAMIETEDDRIKLSLFPDVWEISYVLPIAPMTSFNITNLQVSPSEVKPGENVTISVFVINMGRELGFYDVVLKINGTVEDVKTIMLDGGESTNVKFAVSKEAIGSYSVEIAGLKGEFRVKKSMLTLFPMEYAIYAVLSAILLIAVSIGLFAWRRRKPNIKKIFEEHPYLRQEEKDVLAFLAENNGEAFESEIRKRFPHIPRTSLWRLIRRLEREGIVKIRKVGPGNIVELKK